MSVLKKLKLWFTLDEAARHLTSSCRETFAAADVLRLCLDGYITLSLWFLVSTRARPGHRMATNEQVTETMYQQGDTTQVVAVTPSRSTGECVFLPQHRTTVLADDFALPSEDDDVDDVGLVIEKKVVPVVGILDMLLLSDGRNIAEAMHQKLIGGPAVFYEFDKGIYLEGDDGAVYQLQENFDEKVVDARYQAITDKLRREADDNNMSRYQTQKHMRHLGVSRKAYREMREKTTTMQNYMPASSLPNDAVFVIRAAALMAFESSVCKSENEIAACVPIGAVDAMPRVVTALPTASDALPASSPVAPPASDVSVAADLDAALAEDAFDASPEVATKRDKQVMAIVAVVHDLGYPALRIPTGGKSKILDKCRLSKPELFGGGKHPFMDAWRVALEKKLVRMANHEDYAFRSRVKKRHFPT